MKLMPQEVEYTLAWHTVHMSLLNFNEAMHDWYVPETLKIIFPMGP